MPPHRQRNTIISKLNLVAWKNTIWETIFDPVRLPIVCFAILCVEFFLNWSIIENVPYTEIDWQAYMQEVEGVINGTWDYSQLKGDTGPLVYPAGFVYIYAALYYLTGGGVDIRLAQYVFMGVFLVQTILWHRLLISTAKVPPYALVLVTFTSYRIHSIYVLRLFNDPIALLFFYGALNLWLAQRWTLGSLLYSLSVSVKMSMLLYAPCLLLAYVIVLGIKRTVQQLTLCAIVQLVLAAPFLYTNPIAYLKASFDLGRVFEHRWTVNYRFLPPHIFHSPQFHGALLLLHIALLAQFFNVSRIYFVSYAKLVAFVDKLKKNVSQERRIRDRKRGAAAREHKGVWYWLRRCIGIPVSNKWQRDMNKVAQLFVLPFFVCNLIGIACARSLHYQFYTCYYHSLVYLAMCTKGISKPCVFLLLALLELCWNVYPSTNWSSGLMHACHIVLIVSVYKYMQ